MWLAYMICCVCGFIAGVVTGVMYMHQANEEYKQELERALRDAKAPYEILARDKQEVKNNDSAWW